jgi:hypothetical protein
MATTLTREELHELVWQEALRNIAPRLGVSDTWLRKCCHAADVPLPDQSYWGELRVGKHPPTRPLPPRPPGVPNDILIGKPTYRPSWPHNPDRELAQPEPVAPQFPEPLEAVEARIRRIVPALRVSRDLESPHPLVRHVLDEDEKRRTKPKGIPYRLQYADPLFESAFERRRLRILNAVFLGLAKAGFNCWLWDEAARSTGAVVGESKVGFLLDHPGAKPDHEHRYKTRNGPASDTLRFSLDGGEHVWTDTKDDQIEKHITEIVVQTILAGEAQLRRVATSTYERAVKHRQEMVELKRQRLEEAERKERARREAAERDRRNGLLRLARDHRRANDIRAFVDLVLARQTADPGEAELAQSWADWARAVADRTDPLPRLRLNAEGGWTVDDALPAEPGPG